MPKKPEHKLFKIGYLTKLLDVTPRTIRHYDQIGLLPHVKRSEGHVRLFDEEDIEIIQKIKKLQKEELLSLTEIREHILGRKEDINKTIAIATDSTVVLPPDLGTKNVFVMPLTISINGKKSKDNKRTKISKKWPQKGEINVITPSINEWATFYKSIAKKGFKEIYSIHSQFTDIYKAAEKATYKVYKEIKVTVMNTMSLGIGTGIYINQAADAIQNKVSQKELSILLSKNRRLVWDICQTSNLAFLFKSANKDEPPETIHGQIINTIKDLKPIIVSNAETKKLHYIANEIEIKRGLEIIRNQIDDEIRKRGGYIDEILIAYSHLYKEAVDLMNELKQSYPGTKINMTEQNASTSIFLGPESIGVSLL